MASLVPQSLREHYEKHGQGHVFRFIDEGKVPDGKAVLQFVEQLKGFDVEWINKLFHDTVKGQGSSQETASFEPLEEIFKLSDCDPDEKTKYYKSGLTSIANGEVAAITLSGGQGTRLGFDKPKGEYNIGLPLQKTLFKIQCQKILRLKQIVADEQQIPADQVRMPWYIMTSPATDQDVRDFFEANDYLEFPREDIFFFQQGTLPCLDTEGNFILENSSKVAESPDGNGGIYRALHTSGAIKDMERRGVKFINAFAVDNPLIRPNDPIFVGHTKETNAEIGAKVAKKEDPEEKVGVLCKSNGKYSVVEYSEMDTATKTARDTSGDLRFNAGNLCIHLYTWDFLATKCHPDNLPTMYHAANKKIPYADPRTGHTVPKDKLTSNTGIKLETFIFDVFPEASNVAAIEVSRELEFAPIKNAPGTNSDSPDTARKQYSDMCRNWLKAVGATVSGPDDAAVEISPLVSYWGENLEQLSGLRLEAPLAIISRNETLPRDFEQTESEYQPADPESSSSIMHTFVDNVNIYRV
eukprot:gb/GECG01003440.1/.p1 GENE.gb/GECG01003440.1/~~gb/GECG01003440.1/.p1  ORF type:complete len:525 (+),score=77.26 gb/GECG01003440.1/:1-1575(+)